MTAHRLFQLVVLLLLCPAALAQPPKSLFERHKPVWDSEGMVVTSEEIAARVGAQILAEGGNAIDAAVAVGFAEAVTLPRAGNLGGGGFMVIWLAEQQRAVAINYREKAPARAHKDMFLDAEGNPDSHLSRVSLLATGVPGTVAGLALAQEKYGSMPLKRVIQPAVKLARGGFPVSRALAARIERERDAFAALPAAAAIFLDRDGQALAPGAILRQPDLAKTLEQIAEHGPQAFYDGHFAEQLHAYMAENGGIMTREDLQQYRAEVLKPISAEFHGYRIHSMPPPSSGGVILAQMLNVLEQLPLQREAHNNAHNIHLLAETMSLAYNDRNTLLGDPRFVDISLEKLVSKDYAKSLSRQISTDKHRASEAISSLDQPAKTGESRETTHFSVADRHGNLVANTYTLNGSFGNNHVVPGTGVLLNNEMDDFTAKPGTPNMFGLVQGEANAVAPGKQPLSSMTPAVVVDPEGRPLLATGSPGGSRIITVVLQTLLNRLFFDQNLAQAVAAPRVHHQLWPDTLKVEEGISADTVQLLEGKGHEVRLTPAFTAAQSVEIDHQGGGFWGATDPRKADSAAWGPELLRNHHHTGKLLHH